MNNVFRAYILIITLYSLPLFAQESDEKVYELLAMEIEMLSSYSDFSGEIKELIKLASSYREKGEYDLAVIFLEEVLNQIKSSGQSKKNPEPPLTGYELSGNILSGIDYNRQEFELGFEQSDSVLLDELSKPFIGFDVKYASADELFKIEHSFRYDSENLRNELFFNNRLVNKQYSVEARYGGAFDRNFEYDDLGYYEAYAELSFKNNIKESDWSWQFKNKSRLKRFNEPSLTIPDFFRNSFVAYAVKNFDFYNNMQFDYTMEFNESLKYDNNDFLEHNGGISYQDVWFSDLKIKLAARYRYYNFNYQISDSSFENTSGTVSFNPEMVYELNSYLSVDVEYNMDLKEFSIKTEQEPDYTFYYINPSLVIRFGALSVVNIGYFYENKKHVLHKNLAEQYIKDQDYHSSGLSAGFDYTTFNGTLLSVNAEYSHRRYPNFSSEADFSIYSNRNILNFLLYAQIPLFRNIALNVIGSYDNDKDIDSDFNDTISSFYTVEVIYSF